MQDLASFIAELNQPGGDIRNQLIDCILKRHQSTARVGKLSNAAFQQWYPSGLESRGIV